MNNFKSLINIWKSESANLKLKILRACVFPSAIYGCESWTITKADEEKIRAFEIKCYRRILRIPWTIKETNANILRRLGLKTPQLLNIIKKQKLKFFGHIKRHDTLEKLFLEGKVDGKRGRGRPRRRWSQDIGEWLGSPITEAGRLAKNREMFQDVVREATSGKDMPT